MTPITLGAPASRVRYGLGRERDGQVGGGDGEGDERW